MIGSPAARRSCTFTGVAVGGLLLARRFRARRLSGRPAEPPTVTADDGTHLHVELAGDPDADVTVLLVHGYGARLQEWSHQRSALAPHSRMVLFDLRGHGRSGWGDHRAATLDQLAADLHRVLEEHAGDRPVLLVGHSMGGMAVLALAADQPQLFGSAVGGVALLSTSSGHLMEVGVSRTVADVLRRTHALTPALWALWFAAPLVDRLSPFRTDIARDWLRCRLFGAGPVPREVVDAAQRSFVHTRLSVLAAFAPSLLRHDKAVALDRLHGLPCLVLAGDQDATIPVEHSRRIARELDDCCELVVVPGAGHMVNQTHPEQVSAALLRLLRRLTPPVGADAQGP